ncbi:hypothetical protein NDK50_08040 [Paraburkholderia bryophila]|uniref:hypothetical protein n=1 Tax=Paraburkholderia bryophila TaxID=420952 RepID=UPI00234B2963|nr:hypothetical protein [Paraburkholderia bryophila]WCM21386.1 hypothetical protein NDK50_08040 [Paraburkholderia bryophila]
MSDFLHSFLCLLPFMLVVSCTLSTRRIDAGDWQFWVIAATVGIALWVGKYR